MPKSRIVCNRTPLHKVTTYHSSGHMGQLSVTEALHYSNLVQLFLCFHCFWLLIVITYSYSFSVSAPLWSGPCFYLCAVIKVGMSELVPAECGAGPVSQNQSNRRESNIYISQIYNLFFKFGCFASIIFILTRIWRVIDPLKWHCHQQGVMQQALGAQPLILNFQFLDSGCPVEPPPRYVGGKEQHIESHKPERKPMPKLKV